MKLLVLSVMALRAVFAHDLGATGVLLQATANSLEVRVRFDPEHVKGQDPEAEIARRLKLRLDGQLFQPRNPSATLDKDDGALVWQAVYAGTATSIILEAPIFPERTAESTIVTLLRDGKSAGSAVLQPGGPQAVLGEPLSGTIWRFIILGIEHIFGGPDHIAFLLALLLPGGRIRQLVKVVTAFTLAHSVTLALAAMGLVKPSPWIVEAVIALSIVAAAGENLLPAPEGETKADWRPLFALGFGLIHGFGFAGALAEVGLPPDGLGWALAAFNIGVETGQLAILALVVPGLLWLNRNRLSWHLQVVRYGSMAIMAVGLYWTVQRLFFVG